TGPNLGGPGPFVRRGLCLERELQVHVDGDLVAERQASGLEGGVPVDAEVRTVDLRRRRSARLRLTVAVGRDSAELGRQGDGLRHAAERELAVDEQVVTLGADARRAERHLRELVGGEEVARAEVLVARLLTGVDARDLDRGLDRGVLE